MAYTHVQFIAYEIDTAPAHVVWDDPTGTITSGTYLGPERLDIEARCQLMLRAMQTARDNLPQSSPPTAEGATLHVFLAPEFFFRGRQGAYPMEDVQRGIAALQQLAADESWKDWLFGFGTILGVSAPALGSPPTIDPAAVKEVYNFSLIQKGGVASQGDAGARVVMKELKSGIDFITQHETNAGLLAGAVEHLRRDGTRGPGREEQRLNYDGAGIFDLDGITWGVEICLDHHADVRRLQSSPQLPGASQIQVQLVPSGGMSVQGPSIIAAPGGYVFNCDGLNGGSSALKLVANPPTAIPPSGAAHDVGGGPITLADVSPPEVVTVDQLYQAGPGRIVFYPVRALPPASTVKGSVVPLSWKASDDYTFDFSLVYDEAGALRALLCKPSSTKTNFYDKDYFIRNEPLVLAVRSEQAVKDGHKDPDVSITMRLIPGTGGFGCAVWCDIDTPDFDFHGSAFRFNLTTAGQPPEIIW